MDLQAIKSKYDRDGYAVIPGLFTLGEVEKLRQEAYEIIPKAVEKDRLTLQKRNGHPGLLFWPNNVSEYIRSISRDDRLRSVVNYFIGPDTQQLNNQIYYRESGDGDEFAWHQDISFRTPESDFTNIEENYLQTIIAVDEITEENGAVEFIPGSHKWGNMNLIPRDGTEYGLRKFVRGEWKGEKVCAKPGDLVIWSVLSVHGSEKNESGRNRMTFMNGFAGLGGMTMMGAKKWPIYTKNGVCV